MRPQQASRQPPVRSGEGRPARPAATGGARREEIEAPGFDPRREARRQLLRLAVPDDVDARDLDPEFRQDLRSLAKDTADLTAKHLVMAGRLLDADPQSALAHARAAGALAGRVGSVREAVGLAAYAAQEWAEALSELRAARRITGRADHVAVLADCERALGRPERALSVLDDPDVPKLEQATRVELVIVVAGARRDLDQADAAVLLLQGPARATTARRPWATRLWYAYADALLGAGREDEAREWFAKAAEQDGQGETDALDRLLELEGVVLQDLQDEDGEADEEPEPEPVDLGALLQAPVVRSQGSATGTGDAGGAAASPQAAPSPAVSQPDGVEVAGVEVAGVEVDDGPIASHTVQPGEGPLFSDGEQTAVPEPARPAVPDVSFTPPPGVALDDDDDEEDSRGRG